MTWSVPSAAILEWVADRVGVSAACWSRRLLGGTHALTDVVQTDCGQELVLRRFGPGDDAVQRECRVLPVLDGLGGLAPRVLAADPDGSLTGQPVVVTTMLPGGACITPADPTDFATQLGHALARVHAHATLPLLPDVMHAAPPVDGPTVDSSRDAWDRVSAAPRVLTHFDFWSGNTLWRDARLTGIVDWSGAGRAPRGFDLSWARLDLVLLYDRATADVLTGAYESAAGSVVLDLDWWDLYAGHNADASVEGWAPNYQGLGRTDLGPAALRRRLDDWLSTLHGTR